jgi:poly-gamma-glutamate capsule biosynthesis protein CapA/YwtB (metallophosphatase superfamily)
MVNLETAITTGGVAQNKEFTFRAPPAAFTALRDAGIDVATMANNHGADYGASGVANGYSDKLITAVEQAKAAGYVVVVYVHWGVEYTTCPSGDQNQLAGALAHAGASAVIGTHAHVLQAPGGDRTGPTWPMGSATICGGCPSATTRTTTGCSR